MWLTIEHDFTKFSNTLGEAQGLYNDYVLKKRTQEELEKLKQRAHQLADQPLITTSLLIGREAPLQAVDLGNRGVH